jgi:hypothetical protein
MIVKVYKQTQVEEDVHWDTDVQAAPKNNEDTWVLASKNITVAVVTRRMWFLWDSYECGAYVTGRCEGFKDGKRKVEQALKNKEML